MTLHTWSCLCLERRRPAQVSVLKGWTQPASSHPFFFFPSLLLSEFITKLSWLFSEQTNKASSLGNRTFFLPYVKWYILEEDKQINSRWAPQRVRPGYVMPSMDTCPTLGTVVPRVSRILSNKKCNCPEGAKGTPFLHTRQLWERRRSLK